MKKKQHKGKSVLVHFTVIVYTTPETVNNILFSNAIKK